MKMIASKEQCLEPAALCDLLAGRLSEEHFANAIQHVETCQECAYAAEKAAESSSGRSEFSWIQQAVKANNRLGFDHEPECQAVVGNLLLQPSSRHVSSARSSELPTEMLGPYRLLKWIGSGGMGAVYLAEHQRLKRLSAIKLLPREKLLQTGWLERFNREMTSIAALEHPHIVRAIDAGDEGGWHFLVMEYLDGADLSKVCRQMGEIPLPTACELVRQAALGLGAIHSLGMTHRDIKPSNLFLTRSGNVKLLDLGLVLSGDSPLAADERLTTVGHLMGTVPYMAREQLIDASAVDWRADIYSLGATLFRLLAGRAPFGPAANLAQTIQAISSTACPSLKSLKPDLPYEIVELVDKMLSHNPSCRPQSAQEVAESLAPLCDASAPQSLVRAALNCSNDQEGQLNSQLHFSQLKPCVEVDHAGKTRSRLPRWIAGAFLPIAFFAGIWITLTTDKGTLVIESVEPGVSVKVTQGDRVVDTLRVEKESSVLRLQSGKYTVELSGIEGDALEISDSRVALNRGEKQVVRIQQRKTVAENAAAISDVLPDSNENRFQGKPLAYWLSVLGREKDVATIAQAMHAVSTLAENGEDRLEAARRCLQVARKLGGMVLGGRPSAINASPDASEWFMTELDEIYPTFFPEPGLQVIIEELEHGTERSVQACFYLVSFYANETPRMMGRNSVFRLKEHYAEIAKSDRGRAQLLKLDRLLEQHILRTRKSNSVTTNDSSNIAVGSRFAMGNRFIAEQGVYLRVDILQTLGIELSEDSLVVEWAKKTLEPGVDDVIVQSGMGGPIRSPLPPQYVLAIQRALAKVEHDGIPIALALLEPSSANNEAELTEALSTLAKEKPQVVASAVVKHLERAQKYSGFGPVIQDRSQYVPRLKIAKETLLANLPEPAIVLKALNHALEVKDTTSIFGTSDIEELIQKMTPADRP